MGGGGIPLSPTYNGSVEFRNNGVYDADSGSFIASVDDFNDIVTEVTGNVTFAIDFSGNPGTFTTSKIKTIGRALILEDNTGLTTFKMNDLETIGLGANVSGDNYRGLVIKNNSALTNIGGLANLTKIGDGVAHNANTNRALEISENDELLTISHFPQLTHITSSLVIKNNAKQNMMSKFDELDYAFNINIINLPLVTTFGQEDDDTTAIFPKLTKLSQRVSGYPDSSTVGTLLLQDMNSLTEINAFNGLKEVGQKTGVTGDSGQILITGNNIDGVSDGEVKIVTMTKLTKIKAFNSLIRVQPDVDASLPDVIGKIVVIYADILQSMNAFNAVERIKEYVAIGDDGSFIPALGTGNIGIVGTTPGSLLDLNTLVAFDKLERVGASWQTGDSKIGGSVVIYGNTVLTTIPTFPSVEVVENNIDITENDEFVGGAGIHYFPLLDTVGGNIEIKNNKTVNQSVDLGSGTATTGTTSFSSIGLTSESKGVAGDVTINYVTTNSKTYLESESIFANGGITKVGGSIAITTGVS